jgi:SAM-dependent methyltransferase
MHPAAAHGYERSSEAYDRGRPEYPAEAVSYLQGALGIGPGASVLDLGAGTGKLTRLLAPSGARLYAVEPVEAMRTRLKAAVPTASVLDGTAEAIPVEASALDAVVVAQAFHWFDGPKALCEIHRVLKPHGRLGLVWNVRDESVAWVAALTRIVDRHEAGSPRYRTGAWRTAFEASPLFSPLLARSFRLAHEGPVEQVLDRVASISFIAALEPAARDEVLEEVRALLASDPQTAGRQRLAFPYRTDTFVCTRAG